MRNSKLPLFVFFILVIVGVLYSYPTYKWEQKNTKEQESLNQQILLQEQLIYDQNIEPSQSLRDNLGKLHGLWESNDDHNYRLSIRDYGDSLSRQVVHIHTDDSFFRIRETMKFVNNCREKKEITGQMDTKYFVFTSSSEFLDAICYEVDYIYENEIAFYYYDRGNRLSFTRLTEYNDIWHVEECQAQICPTYTSYRNSVDELIHQVNGVEIVLEELNEIKKTQIFHPLNQNNHFLSQNKPKDLQILSSNSYLFKDKKGNDWVHGSGVGFDFDLVLYQLADLTDGKNYVIQVYGIDFEKVYINTKNEVYVIVKPLFDLYADDTEEFSGQKVVKFNLKDLEKNQKELDYIY